MRYMSSKRMSCMAKALGCLLAVCLAFGALPAMAPKTVMAAGTTVTVAAPTGDAATDTASIANALASAGPDDTIALAAGDYVVSGTINITKSNFTLKGAGMDTTRILSTSMGTLMLISGVHNFELSDLTLDGSPVGAKTQKSNSNGLFGTKSVALYIHNIAVRNIGAGEGIYLSGIIVSIR